MISVVQAFDRFLHSLDLTDTERADVTRLSRLLRERLAKDLGGVRRDILAGAYGRGTAVRPLHDVDFFIVLDASTHGGLREEGPRASLEAIQGALLKAGSAKEQIEQKRRGVNLRPGGGEVGFDVVPAFEESPEVYWIPDRERQGWIKTNPSALGQAVTRANERAGGKLIPVIKAARYWSGRHGKPVRGLHLEALAARALPTPPLNYPGALRQLFSKLADTGQRSCPDPCGVGPDLDAGMNHEDRSRLRIIFQDATRQADQALQYDRTWRADEAHSTWRSLLGELYPETGRR